MYQTTPKDPVQVDHCTQHVSSLEKISAQVPQKNKPALKITDKNVTNSNDQPWDADKSRSRRKEFQKHDEHTTKTLLCLHGLPVRSAAQLLLIEPNYK